MKVIPRGGKRSATWQEVYDKWIAAGYHPKSAQFQADDWQRIRDGKKRRAEKAKESD